MTKKITTTIYFSALIIIIFLDINRFYNYFILVFAVNNLIQIISDYVIANRKINYEISLVRLNSEPTKKQWIISVLIITIILALFKLYMEMFFLVFLWAVVIQLVSYLIQYLIIKSKSYPDFTINQQELAFNDLFLKKYSLDHLRKINFDKFTDVYILLFKDDNRLEIRKGLYAEEDLMIFLSELKNRSNAVISEDAKIIPSTAPDQY
ncbi:MAG: hypothetical protein K2Q24_06890 [Chitinophagaceae bacterium]|nr:hypothetical protein [Chitinophagaceae bacterium]